MAWVSEALEQWEIDAMARGASLLCGGNALAPYVESESWRLGDGWTDPVAIDFSSPPSRARDHRGSVITRPGGASGEASVSLLFDLGSYPISFDCAFVLGHNATSLGDIEIGLAISDVNDFDAGDPSTVEIATWSPATLSRLSSLALGDGGGDRYSGVRYVRLQFRSSGALTAEPEVTELWLGRRRQLEIAPELPFDLDAMRANERDAWTGSVRNRYAGHHGRATLSPTYRMEDGDRSLTQIRQWWTECGHGRTRTIYVPDCTAPSSFVLCDASDFAARLTRGSIREVTVSLDESLPFLSGGA
jgi:hypothetical protein